MKINIVKKHLIINGMTCINCQNRIQKKLQNTPGIVKAAVSYADGAADITYNSDILSLERITSIIEALDYQVLPEGTATKQDTNRTLCILMIILFLFVILQYSGILNLLAPGRLADTKMGYGMLFVIGLITSVHCIAMCGGINLSQSLPRKKETNTFLPSFLYNLGRVVSYTLIGALLGFLGFLLGGGAQTGTPLILQGCIKLIAGIWMVIMGINMLNLFPGLRKLNLRPPKFLAAKINTEKVKTNRPFIIGLLNGLMPCGPLQSMQLVALSSGNPLAGALSMLCFSLGTVPLMLGLGSLVAALSRKFTRAVMNIGAVLVVVLGLAMLSQGFSLSGLSSGFHSLFLSASDASPSDTEQPEIVDGVQVVNSTLSPGQYPSITVQAGIPVKWIINAPEGSINGCNYKMYIQEYGIEYTFQTGENILEFTPDKAGIIEYSCWMGMIHGTISVTDETGTAPASEAAEAQTFTGWSCCG